tara:strand:+ start:673 stop:936 length:264 start_codon:yes stop_codon:yes gene_type:complete
MMYMFILVALLILMVVGLIVTLVFMERDITNVENHLQWHSDEIKTLKLKVFGPTSDLVLGEEGPTDDEDPPHTILGPGGDFTKEYRS